MGSGTKAFVELDECISIYLMSSFFFFFLLAFMTRTIVIWIFLLNYLTFFTLMPCLYVLLYGPLILKGSCILLSQTSLLISVIRTVYSKCTHLMY